MQQVFPDYYKEFKCTAQNCKHNCCIGWEIDIDPCTAEYYKSLKGDFGEKIRSNIQWSAQPFFKLTENERCPFLNKNNLCDIIINLGEEHICSICTDHPRFRNELPHRIETGLGLSCEAAAKLILGRTAPMTLQISGSESCDDEIICLRDKVILLLQNRSKTVEQRMEDMLKLCGASLPLKSPDKWADLLLSLERLDSSWTDTLVLLKKGFKRADLKGFNLHMKERQTEYEQFCVYLIYRHFANAPTKPTAAARAAFAALGTRLLYSIGAVIWTETASFTFSQQTEIARMFSSEIEYSDENLYTVLDWLST